MVFDPPAHGRELAHDQRGEQENRLFKRHLWGPSGTGTDWPTMDVAWGSWGLAERTLGCRRPAA